MLLPTRDKSGRMSMMAGPQEVEILKWMMQHAIHLICERSRQASILTQVVALFRIVESYIEEEAVPKQSLRGVEVCPFFEH